MLRHHDITRDVAAVPRADSIEFCLESVFRHQTIEQRHALIATERDEMQAALGLIADWFDVHLLQIVVGTGGPPSRKKTREGWGNPELGIPCERRRAPKEIAERRGYPVIVYDGSVPVISS